MVHNVLQYGLAGATALFALLALLLRSKRGVLVWAAVMAGSAAFAAHYDVFWATAFFGLAAIWAVFCAGNTIDLAWRAKTGFVLFLTLGSALCIYPTYHDERYGKWAPPAELKSDEQAKMEVDARHGDLGWSEFLLTNIPFRLVRGLDLKGGLRLVYTVEVDKAIEDKRDRLYDDLRNALSVAYGFTGADKVASVEELAKLPSKVKVEKYNDQPSIVTLRFDDPANASVINDEFLKRFLKENQLIRAADKKSITFRISSAAESEIRTKAVALAKDTVQKRVDDKGLKEASVTIRDEDIIIEMPGDDEKSFAETRDLISTTARLEFKMVDDNVDYFEAISRSTPASALPEGVRFEVENAPVGPGRTKPVHFARLTKLPQETMAGAFQRLKHWTDTLQVDPDHEIGFEKVQDFSEENETFDYVGWRTIYLFSKAEVTGDMVRKAEHLNQQTDRGMAGWIVSMEFSPVGADRFEEVTAKNIMRRFAIVLDGKVESAPRILSKIAGGHCQITMGASSPDQQLKEAEKLATVLRSGALPAPISPTNEQRIGPSLGRDALTLGLKGAASGAALVLLFMVVYYSRAGMIANAAVILNLIFQVAILAMFGASMTLPGIAGLVLTIGIAVDANVLINERIREELRHGKSPRAAVDVGYDKAFSAIVDGHMTTLISGLILAQFGTGPIKGFAYTLMIGISASLFTGVVCTRLMFDWAVRHRKVKNLHLG